MYPNAEVAHPVAWLDVDRAADYLSLSPGAVRAMVKREQLPVHRTPTGRLLFRPEELDAWVESGERA